MPVTVGRTDNKRAADLFYDLALAMELQGERWRANSYYRAAKSLEELGEHIRSISERRELRRIEGVGESIEAKLDEFLTTGRISALEGVRDILPEDLDLLRDIPPLGTRKLADLDILLGIRSVDELLRAAYEGRLAELPDFDEGDDRKVLEYLTWKREEAADIPTPYALRSAHRIIDYLRETDGLKRIEIAGPVRRRVTTVANVTLLFSSSRPDAVIARFGLSPEVTELTTVEREEAVGRTSSGAACMVRSVKEESFGLELLKATGPDQHVRELSNLAKEQGHRLTPTGLGKDRTRIEEGIYNALGREYLRPECRDGRKPHHGELLGRHNLLGDLHVRSTSFDGGLRVLEMAGAARNLGHKYVCIVDRVGGRRMDPQTMERRNELIDTASDILGMPILKGAEVSITPDGTVDYSPSALEQLDMVIGTVNTKVDMPGEEMTDRLVKAMDEPNLDVIGHPTNRVIGLREPAAIDLRRVAEAAADRMVALEVNAYPDRLDLSDEHIYNLYDTGVLFSLGTDAAFPNELGYWEWAVTMSARAFLTVDRALNAMDADKIRGRRWRS